LVANDSKEDGMDIIADVMQQADPVQARAGLQRLQKHQSVNPARVQAAQLRATPFHQDQSRLTAPKQDDRALAERAVMQKLETVLATKMVEAMLPKDQSRLYGEGTAGEVWRGFHIEAMGKAIAEEDLLSTSLKPAVQAENPGQNPSRRSTITPFSG
jgi:peptidoglycan hydrolase FlgJ